MKTDRKTSAKFVNIALETSKHGETNDCAIKAICLVTGAPYSQVRDILAKYGRKTGNGTYRHWTQRCLEELGYTSTRWSFMEREEMIRSYPSPHHNLKSITTHHPNRFKAAWSKHADKTMLFFVRGHVLAVSEAQVHDWTVHTSKRVEEIWTITKK